MKTTFSFHNFLTIFCLTLIVGLLMRALGFPDWEGLLCLLISAAFALSMLGCTTNRTKGYAGCYSETAHSWCRNLTRMEKK